MRRGSQGAALLPLLATGLVVLLAVVFAVVTGFYHPRGDDAAFRPMRAASPLPVELLVTDLRWRIRWSLSALAWLVSALLLIPALLGVIRRDCTVAGAPALLALARYGALGLAIAMLALELAGVAFAGPLAERLALLPETAVPGGIVAAGLIVNVVASVEVWLLAFAFSATVRRAAAAPGAAQARARAQADGLLLAGAVAFALVALEVALRYRWAASLTAWPAGGGDIAALAAAVATSQATVIAAVLALLLGVVYAAARYALAREVA